MPTNISTILLNATKEKVWDALTKPELVKLWLFNSDMITNWEVGSSIQFKTEWDGGVFEQWGSILEVRINELIKYNLFAPRPNLEDKPENYFITTYILTVEHRQTKLEFIQEDNRSGAVQEEPGGEENPILQSLKKIVEIK
ncbi:MAG: SRPBCC family protein [Ferruginibacter sp.]